MKISFIKTIFLISLFTFLPYILHSQEIEANVSVNMEQIEPENRIDVSTLENDLEDYINNQRFTDYEWEGPPIPVDVSIVLAGGYQNKYSARLFIASQRYIYGTDGGTSVTLRLVDNKWAFEYSRGAIPSYNPTRFNLFSSLIDFYMLVVIGYDLDTYDQLDGTETYEMAKRICQLGSTNQADGYSTFSNPGEFTRYALVSELTDLRFEPLRKMIFEYYVDGLDMMEEDEDLAYENLTYFIADLVDFKKNTLVGPSVVMQAFFDAKAEELANLFKDRPNADAIFNSLIYLNPTKTTLYEETRDGF